MKLKLFNIIIVLLVIALWFAWNAFLFIEDSKGKYFGYMVIASSLLCLQLIYKISYREITLLSFSLFLLLVVIILNFSVAKTPLDISLSTTIFLGFLLGNLALKHDKTFLILKTIYKITFFYAIIIFVMLTLNVNPNEIWLGSQNTSSQIFVMVGAFFLIYTPVLEFLRHKLLFYIVIVGICLMSIGRSGIITSIILLVAYCWYAYLRSSKSKRNLLLLCLLFLLLIGGIFQSALFELISNWSKLDYLNAKGIHDVYRTNMIIEFFDHYNIGVFVFGVDLSQLPYIASFNSNPHNGFIKLHASLGIYAVFLFILIIVVAVRLLQKRAYPSILALVALLLRFSTDEVSGVILIPFLLVVMYAFYIDVRGSSHSFLWNESH